MGELLVEIMRDKPDVPLSQPGYFRGPYPSGAPAIFIDTVSRLGVPAGIYGAVGPDEFGSNLVDRLNADGVDCRYVLTSDRQTACAFVSYFSDGSRKFIFHFDGMAAVEGRFHPPELADAPSFFHIMGCSLMANESFTEEILKAMAWFHEAGAKVSFDPNIRVELLKEKSLSELVGPVMERTSVLLPGTDELTMLTSKKDPRSAVATLFDRHAQLELVVLKRGAKGATVFSRDTETSVPAAPVEEVDPTGAGDCFDAGFLSALVKGLSPEQAATVAAKAGAANAGAFGPMEGVIDPGLLEV
jgi:sugar/nucleoside kinase (ribokinase family)